MFRFFPRFEYVIGAACLVGLASFGYHGFLGSRSYNYQASLEEKVAKLETNNAVLDNELKNISAKVSLMRPESVDPDLVDELARAELGLVKATDLILPLSK